MNARALLMLLGSLLILAGCATTPPGELTPDQKASQINTQLGSAYLRQNRIEQALDRLTKAVRQDPDNAEAHSVLAVLHHHLGQRTEADRHYRRSVALAPDDSALLNNYGQFLCEQGKVKEGERYLEQAAANPLYRTPEVPLANAGICLLRDGQHEVAEEYFRKALRANPNLPRALFAMAELRQKAGQSLSARGFYQRYLAVAPQTPESLWLGILIERELGDKDAVGSYSLLLRRQYPDSEEAHKLIELEKEHG